MTRLNQTLRKPKELEQINLLVLSCTRDVPLQARLVPRGQRVRQVGRGDGARGEVRVQLSLHREDQSVVVRQLVCVQHKVEDKLAVVPVSRGELGTNRFDRTKMSDMDLANLSSAKDV